MNTEKNLKFSSILSVKRLQNMYPEQLLEKVATKPVGGASLYSAF
jgi:hypothetical protein